VSVPRLVVCGLEPGPAVALAAGALVACLGAGERAVRPVTVGLDLPLWRLLYGISPRAPRVLDLALHQDDVAAELYDSWAETCDLLLLVAVEPALDRWQQVAGSRAVDVAEKYDAPLVLVVDARERGATAAAAVCGVRQLARRVEIAGVVVVGGDERGAGAELGRIVRREAGLQVLGWIPPQLSEQFVRQYTSAGIPRMRQIGPRPAPGSELRLCEEAATYLHRDELEAAAGRRGYLPARPRRVLAPAPAATGLTLAVGWGPPLEPFALENIDVFQAMGVTLAPLHVSRDRVLPPDTSGLLLMGQLDEEQLGAVAENRELLTLLAQAVDEGLPTLAVGGGALLLLRRLADSRGRSHELAGVLPAEAELLEWYERPRYVRARATRGNPFDEGETVLYELFDLEFLLLEQGSFAYDVGAPGEATQAEGFTLSRCLATTLYPSLPLRPSMASAFVDAMRLAGPRE
jgi:cobyrinic acid a,c-diamide synthase